MATDKFYIGYLDNNSGLQTDVKPFAIADNAFEALTNAYVFRGRVRKRFGSRLMNGLVSSNIAPLYSRLRINIGTTDGPGPTAGDFSKTVSVVVPGATGAKGQMFSVGTTMFTAYLTNGTMLTTGPHAVGTYNTGTTVLAITGNGDNPSTAVYWYPGYPVMGLIPFENPSINEEPVIAFDTHFSYQYTGGAWERIGAAHWTGTDSQFFWGCNYRGINDTDFSLFVVNYNAADEIQFLTGTTWTNITPKVIASGATTLRSARLVAWFHKRLFFLNTIERTGGVDATYPNRVRYSFIGDPDDVNAFVSDTPGKGGFIDASTKEAIVSCGFLKDRLIVYFERSTWEIVYTGNDDADPFVFQKINTELGVESTFSAVPFDKVLLGMGNVGVHACNGTNVARIDQKIPSEVFQISNEDQGVYRVYGIRDYPTQMVYWAFVDKSREVVYPNRVLVFNYMTGSWALNEDTITCFGYYQPSTGATWASSEQTWEESVGTWAGGAFDAKYRFVIAGNQEGFVFIVDPDLATNAPALQVTDILYAFGTMTFDVYNHNLEDGSYVKFTNCVGVSGVNDKIFRINVNSTLGANKFSVMEDPADPFVGTYLGGGTVTRVSNINILTKQYNFYVDQGRNAYISKVDFHLDKTSDGQVTVDAFDGSTYLSSITQGTATGALSGTGVLETSPYALSNLEKLQERIWHPLYFQVDGECIQFRIYMDDAQMTNTDISESDFQLNAMIIYATPTASRLQ